MVASVAFKLFELCIVIIIVAVTTILSFEAVFSPPIFAVYGCDWILFWAVKNVYGKTELTELNKVPTKGHKQRSERGGFGCKRFLGCRMTVFRENISLCDWVCAWFALTSLMWMIESLKKMKANQFTLHICENKLLFDNNWCSFFDIFSQRRIFYFAIEIALPCQL